MGLRPFFSTICLGPNREVWSPVSDPGEKTSDHERAPLLFDCDAGDCADIARLNQHARPDGEIQTETANWKFRYEKDKGISPRSLSARGRARVLAQKSADLADENRPSRIA